MMMTKLAALGFLTVGAGTVAAQTATQTVTFQVDPINQLGVTGAPVLHIATSVAGNAPAGVTSSVSTLALTTNQTNAKVTATLSAPMPAGVTLSAAIAAPTGATSAGIKALGTTSVDLITALTHVNASALTLTYQLDATPAAGVVPSGTRVVTYTITGGV
jgi:hypothetical protein